MHNLVDRDSPSNPEFAETRQVFVDYVNDLTTRLVELQESDLEAIKQAGSILIDSLELSPEIFANPARSVMFTAIAKRLAEKGAENSEETEFCHDATVLLALEHSGLYETMKPNIGAELVDEDDERDLEVLNQFTDPELTERLQVVISEKMHAVRERLQVSGENEDTFQVKVLAVGGNAANFYGLQPTMPRELLEPDAPQELRDAHLEKYNAYKEYEKRLLGNNERYNEQTGKLTDLPAAWVTTIKEVRYLCMPDPVARKILDADTVIQQNGYTRAQTPYDRSDESREYATLEHEFTHLMGGLAVDENIFFGISIEEFRAEKFSGNRQGYLDAKQFLRYGLGPITGFVLDDYMDANVKGGSQDHFYEDMAASIGLDAALEVALAAPSAYLHESRPLHSRLNEYLGGYDGILMRLYEKAEDKSIITEKLAKVARKMVDMSESSVQAWFNVLERSKLQGLAALYQEQLDIISAGSPTE